MLPAVGLAFFGGDAAVAEAAVNLVVEFFPVGDDQERPVAGNLSQHLLGEERHRQRLAAPLRVPEDPQPSLVGLDLVQSGDSIVHTQKLVVLGRDLDQPTLRFIEEAEVLYQVQKPSFVARSPDDGLQRNAALFPFRVDPFPVGEVFPARRHAADLRLSAVRQNDDCVKPEQLRNGALVIFQVVLEGVFQLAVGLLEFDEQQRQPVDEADQIGPPFVDRAGNPELRHQGEVIVGRVGPVDDAEGLVHLFAIVVLKGDLHAVFEQPVNVPVGVGQAHRTAIPGQFIDRQLNGIGRDAGVQLCQRRLETGPENNIAGGLPAECGVWPADFLSEAVRRAVTQLGKQGDGRLFDQGVFGIVGGHGCGQLSSCHFTLTFSHHSFTRTPIKPLAIDESKKKKSSHT